MVANHVDSVTGLWSGAPQQVGGITQVRSTAKATLSHYQPALWGEDHEWKVGGQFDRGEHRAHTEVPTGVRYTDKNG
jgi:hypothetical protein